MATIKQLKTKVNDINFQGRKNLATKRVYLDENATTYDIIRKIADIKGGTLYEDVEYKEDGTVVFREPSGKEHIMECIYFGPLLEYVIFDGEIIEAEYDYDNDRLLRVGETEVDLVRAPIYGIAPLDYTVLFYVDDDAFEKITVKRGNSIRSPLSIPTSIIPGNASFSHWKGVDGAFEEGCTPTRDTVFNAVFNTVLEDFYIKNGIDRSIYSEFIMRRNGINCWVYVAKPGTFEVKDLLTSVDGGKHTYLICPENEFYQVIGKKHVDEKVTDPNLIMKCAIPDGYASESMAGFRLSICLKDDDYCYTNAGYTGVSGHWVKYGEVKNI